MTVAAAVDSFIVSLLPVSHVVGQMSVSKLFGQGRVELVWV